MLQKPINLPYNDSAMRRIERGVQVKEKISVAFSGGKDSTLLIHQLFEEQRYEIDSIFVTVTEDRKSTSHRVDEYFIQLQAEALGLPLEFVRFPNFTKDNFENSMIEWMAILKKRGVNKIAYGDLYLEDVRVYKEQFFKKYNVELVVPLWKKNTADLVHKFVDLGYSAYIICVDKNQLDPSFLGKKLTHQTVEQFPGCVDPCGENGEYHTFVWDGPIFKHPIPVRLSDTSDNIDQRWYYKRVLSSSAHKVCTGGIRFEVERNSNTH